MKISKTIQPLERPNFNEWHKYLNNQVKAAKGYPKSEKAIVNNSTNK